ncbi:alpha/beta fold hydrolase [Williamsia herbipolensis]|uniref:alpha/beta fold hydrolase n=1 Tax=Williamsia herbipolensis TaxID=1603258 RepID=UPI0006982547|nr:alpha/beta hydrolase [Williamsia herbipolensis]
MTHFRTRSATGPGGVEIAYRVSAPPAEPTPALVLIHGWAQSAAAWGTGLLDRLAETHRVIAVDLRGHGASGVPTQHGGDAVGASYSAADFAGDIEAVLAAEASTTTSAFDSPAVADAGVVLAGWSYGGLVSCDLLAARLDRTGGVGDVVGLVLVGAITSIGRGAAGGRVGPAMRAALPDACSADPRTAIRALGSFGTALVPAHRPELGAVSQQLFGTSLATAPSARAGLFARTADHDPMLRDLTIPVLIVHGTADAVVDVSAARHAADLVGHARVDLWDDAGHAPFVEDPDRFAESVLAFTESIGSDVGATV